jgi:membrane protease YdiL (CAAX protease family)
VVAAVGEEFLFRSVATSGRGAGWALACVLAAVAFVARHHVPRGADACTRRTDLAVQVVAAVLLLGLTVASGSLYPAVLCHLLANTPTAVLAVQRATPGASS